MCEKKEGNLFVVEELRCERGGGKVQCSSVLAQAQTQANLLLPLPARSSTNLRSSTVVMMDILYLCEGCVWDENARRGSLRERLKMEETLEEKSAHLADSCKASL